MAKQKRGRVDITTHCKPDYSRPDPDASFYGFVIQYGEETITFWATDPKDFFWRVALKKFDYPRIYEEFAAVAKGRTKLSKLIKPAFKFAEEHQQPIYVNGIICTLFEMREVADVSAAGEQSPQQSVSAGHL